MTIRMLIIQRSTRDYSASFKDGLSLSLSQRRTLCQEVWRFKRFEKGFYNDRWGKLLFVENCNRIIVDRIIIL